MGGLQSHPIQHIALQNPQYTALASAMAPAFTILRRRSPKLDCRGVIKQSSTRMVNSVSFGSPHVRHVWALSTCGA